MSNWIKKKWPFSRKVSLQTIGGPATIQALASALEPIAGGKNRYEAYRNFLRMDPEANNAISRLALLVQYAYKGMIVHAEQKLEEKEKELQKRANTEANNFDFRGRFYAIARHLLRDGDEVWVTHFEEKGIQQIQPLPIAYLTAVENEQQISNTSLTVTSAKIYIVNEGVSEKEKRFPENNDQKVFHVSLDNYGEEILDLQNRKTFGVWSESPLECLRSRILWKQAILLTDILWRYRNVPREVHEVDVSFFSPDKFAGATQEARLQAYTNAVQQYLKDYAKEIQKKKVDQGYIIMKGNKVYYTEPTKVTYTSPNDVIEQINESIREGLGWYKVGRGTFATELVTASYVILLPDMIAYKIRCALLDMLKMHLKKKFNYTDDDLASLDMRISLVLDILRGEVVRQIAVLAAAGTHTIDELRTMIGNDPLTDEQIQRLVQISSRGRRGQFAQTLLDILNVTSRQTEPTEPITPESRREKQQT